MRSFLHCADLHVDSPLRGLERYEGAPATELRASTRGALVRLVDLALRQAVDGVLMAGDLFDGSWPDFNTGLFFAGQMRRLREAEIAVFVVRGNHDAESRIPNDLPWPDNVHVFAPDAPSTVVVERLGVAIHGQSFATPAETRDLAAGYPLPVRGLFNIGLLHTCVGGREGHEPYAPCSLDRLRAHGYEYWALGHVHAREVLSESPWVVFPGNTQGRHVQESGARGCTLVRVDDAGRCEIEAHALDELRWARISLDAGEVRAVDDLQADLRRALATALRDAEGRRLAARIEIRGASAAHESLARRPDAFRAAAQDAANDVGGGAIWLEKIVVDTRPAIDRVALALRDDPIGELLRGLDALAADSGAAKRLASCLSELDRRLPEGLRDSLGSAARCAPNTLPARLEEIERLLLPLLLTDEDAR